MFINVAGGSRLRRRWCEMTGSASLIWVMCVVIVASLAVWLTLVALATRKPDHEHPPVPARDVPVGDAVVPDQRRSR
jgi:hypothetical protein